jgi:dipeptidyl aminopeptidase/acylaminoacyl peptidase
LQEGDYADARKEFQTKLTRRGPAPQQGERLSAPRGAHQVKFPSDDLQLTAWVSFAAFEGGKRPAVLFLHGGFALGQEDWDMAKPYEKEHFVVMMPALRGENNQSGYYTMFYDEVDDVVAAGEYLAKLPGVDPNKVYVAGHSAGGTLTLLAALTSKRFRAAASFSGSPDQKAFLFGATELARFDSSDINEIRMRSPVAWAGSFKCPVRMYYGTDESFPFGVYSQETANRAKSKGLDVEAERVPGNHFTSAETAIRRSVTFFKQH